MKGQWKPTLLWTVVMLELIRASLAANSNTQQRVCSKRGSSLYPQGFVEIGDAGCCSTNGRCHTSASLDLHVPVNFSLPAKPRPGRRGERSYIDCRFVQPEHCTTPCRAIPHPELPIFATSVKTKKEVEILQMYPRFLQPVVSKRCLSTKDCCCRQVQQPVQLYICSDTCDTLKLEEVFIDDGCISFNKSFPAFQIIPPRDNVWNIAKDIYCRSALREEASVDCRYLMLNHTVASRLCRQFRAAISHRTTADICGELFKRTLINVCVSDVCFRQTSPRNDADLLIRFFCVISTFQGDSVCDGPENLSETEPIVKENETWENHPRGIEERGYFHSTAENTAATITSSGNVTPFAAAGETVAETYTSATMTSSVVTETVEDFTETIPETSATMISSVAPVALGEMSDDLETASVTLSTPSIVRGTFKENVAELETSSDSLETSATMTPPTVASGVGFDTDTVTYTTETVSASLLQINAKENDALETYSATAMTPTDDPWSLGEIATATSIAPLNEYESSFSGTYTATGETSTKVSRSSEYKVDEVQSVTWSSVPLTVEEYGAVLGTGYGEHTETTTSETLSSTDSYAGSSHTVTMNYRTTLKPGPLESAALGSDVALPSMGTTDFVTVTAGGPREDTRTFIGDEVNADLQTTTSSSSTASFTTITSAIDPHSATTSVENKFADFMNDIHTNTAYTISESTPTTIPDDLHAVAGNGITVPVDNIEDTANLETETAMLTTSTTENFTPDPKVLGSWASSDFYTVGTSTDVAFVGDVDSTDVNAVLKDSQTPAITTLTPLNSLGFATNTLSPVQSQTSTSSQKMLQNDLQQKPSPKMSIIYIPCVYFNSSLYLSAINNSWLELPLSLTTTDNTQTDLPYPVYVKHLSVDFGKLRKSSPSHLAPNERDIAQKLKDTLLVNHPASTEKQVGHQRTGRKLQKSGFILVKVEENRYSDDFKVSFTSKGDSPLLIAIPTVRKSTLCAGLEDKPQRKGGRRHTASSTKALPHEYLADVYQNFRNTQYIGKTRSGKVLKLPNVKKVFQNLKFNKKNEDEPRSKEQKGMKMLKILKSTRL